MELGISQNDLGFFNEYRRKHTTERNAVSSFYYTEQKCLSVLQDQLAHKEIVRVFDFGCAFGGLKSAISQIFPRTQYTGFDIMPGATAEAEKKHPDAVFVTTDLGSIEHLSSSDITFALSVFDWNLGNNNSTHKIIRLLQQQYLSGAYVMFTLRTSGDIKKSHVTGSQNVGESSIPYTIYSSSEMYSLCDTIVSGTGIKGSIFTNHGQPNPSTNFGFLSEVSYHAVLLSQNLNPLEAYTSL